MKYSKALRELQKNKIRNLALKHPYYSVRALCRVLKNENISLCRSYVTKLLDEVTGDTYAFEEKRQLINDNVRKCVRQLLELQRELAKLNAKISDIQMDLVGTGDFDASEFIEYVEDDLKKELAELT